MKVLIFGGYGQTGSYLRPMLIDSGYDVLAPFNTKNTQNRGDNNLFEREVDITISENVRKIIREFAPDYVVNLASLSSVYECEKNPELSERVNLVGVTNIANACIELQDLEGKNVTLIQASSSEMYCGLGSNITINENSRLSPVSVYGQHKAKAFEYLDGISNKLKVSNAILFNHESPRRPLNFVSQKIVEAVTDLHILGRTNLKFGNMSTRRDWSYAGDVAAAISLMVKSRAPSNYIIASNSLHSVEDFYLTACDLLEVKNGLNSLEFDSSFMRKSENDGLQGDSTKIKNVLNWNPEYDFESLVELMVTTRLSERLGPRSNV